MTITEARTSHDQIVQGVIIFLDRIGGGVDVVIAQRVKFQKFDSQVGDLEQFHNLEENVGPSEH